MTRSIEREKQAAAEAGAALVCEGMRVGLGTGSTVAESHALDSLMTPAESLRAAVASRTPLKTASAHLVDAKPAHGTTASSSKRAADSRHAAPMSFSPSYPDSSQAISIGARWYAVVACNVSDSCRHGRLPGSVGARSDAEPVTGRRRREHRKLAGHAFGPSRWGCPGRPIRART